MRYVGEPLAVVVAESAALAEDALDAILVDIEPLPAVADRDAARRGDSILFEAAGTNLASTMTAVRGDAGEAFKTAPYVRRERFKVQRQVREYEPKIAVFSGDTGMEIYQRLVPAAQPALKPGGWLVMEIGFSIEAAVRELLTGWSEIRVTNDLQGIPRVVAARKSR